MPRLEYLMRILIIAASAVIMVTCAMSDGSAEGQTDLRIRDQDNPRASGARPSPGQSGDRASAPILHAVGYDQQIDDYAARMIEYLKSI